MYGKMRDVYKVWKDIYMCSPSWSSYKTRGVKGTMTHSRKLLNMAKIVAEEFSNLVWSEPPKVNLDDQDAENFITGVFEDNKFESNMGTYIEYLSALGGFVIKIYKENNKFKLDFVTPDNFIITQQVNGKITGAKFKEVFTADDNKDYIKYEEHGFIDDNGIRKYVIKNYVTDIEGKNIFTVDKFTEYQHLDNETKFVGITKPLFHYVKNYPANNIVIGSPYGISSFANSLSTLEAIDVCYDALNNEVILGRKRILVPTSYIQKVIDPDTGKESRYFNEIVFEAFNDSDGSDFNIQDNTQELRIDELVASLNAHLKILASQTGFSLSTFSFDVKNGLKTATEVVSDDRRSYRTKSKVQTILDETIKDLVENLLILESLFTDINYSTTGINVKWNDNLFDSDDSRIDRATKLVTANIISRRQALKELFGYSDEKIDKIFNEIEAEQKLINQNTILEVT